MPSGTGTLNKSDWIEWSKQTLIYSVILPALLVLINQLQGGANWKVSLTTALYAVLSALVNLGMKYSAGSK